jgi:hypothetical protein
MNELYIFCSVMRIVFPEDGERCDDRCSAFRITILGHDIAYTVTVEQGNRRSEIKINGPKTSAGLRYSSHRGPLTNS